MAFKLPPLPKFGSLSNLPPMNRQRLILITGIVLAILAVFLVKVYIDQNNQINMKRAQMLIQQERQNQASVLVAKQEIPKGTAVTQDMVAPAIVPNEFVQPQAVTTLDRIDGMVTIAPIAQGEQVSLSKLAFPSRTSGGLASVTPIGKRAISMQIENIEALSGMVKPGDYVDIIALLPIPVQTEEEKTTTQVAVVPLFQNVLVLAVGREIGAEPQTKRYAEGEEQQQQTVNSVTVALGVQEASLLTFVSEQGKLRLVLRSPSDSQIEPVSPASWDTLFQYIMPKQPEPVVEPQKDTGPEPEGYIEIYRGMEKERVPIFQ